jgi:peptidoglycan hydrolase-like protein with peptidoglycan-binding domain
MLTTRDSTGSGSDRLLRSHGCSCACAQCRRRRRLELEAFIDGDRGVMWDNFLPAIITRDIRASVGHGGSNREDDVRSVQFLLNKFIMAQRLSRRTPLEVDGRVGPQTIGGIEDFQRIFVGMRSPDGRVDPGGRTLEKLNGSVLQPAAASSADLPLPTDAGYLVVQGQPYGPKWRTERPPGLPATTRRTSARGAAESAIRRSAGRHSLGDAFTEVVSHLAQTESGAMYARPADTFDARPPAQRPSGKSLITAWGVFQFNRDAWRSLPGVPKSAFPWGASAAEEVDRPVARYAELFDAVSMAGGDDLAAARGVRLWHRSPAAFRQYLKNGRQSGFATAWAAVLSRHRAPVDRRMGQIGLLGGRDDKLSFEIEPKDPATFTVGATDCGCVKCRRKQEELEALIEGDLDSIEEYFLPAFIKRDISASVGRGGTNHEDDVRSIQVLLNFFIAAQRLTRRIPLRVDGKIGPATISAIEDFQRIFVGMSNPDGRVDPGGRTLERLNDSVTQPTAASSSGSSAPPPGKMTIPEVSALLPDTSPGLYAVKGPSLRYGLPETIDALKRIGLLWFNAYPTGPRIRIADISRRGGGIFTPHGSHRLGIDVDIGLIRSDGREEKVNFKTQQSVYSRSLTQKLVDTIRENGVLKVHRIYFADRGVKNVNYDNVHNDHLHVRFCMPSRYNLNAMKRVAFPSGTKGSYSSCR